MTKTRELPSIGSIGSNESGKGYDKIQEIRSYLDDNFEIRINCFDHSKSIIKSRNANRYKFPPTFNDISLELSSAGITHSDTVLRKILSSPNQIETYNPITDYFESIKGSYKGTSNIDMIGQYIIARDFGDKKKGYYQARMLKLLKKWMAATVACALGKFPNEVAIGLIQREEGIGKTFFFKWIIPEQLKEFYAESDKDPKKFDMQESFAKNFLVNFEELVGLNNNTADLFKKTMCNTSIPVKMPREPYPIILPRISSAVFTSNRTTEMGGFLTQSMGYRRFAAIEIETIDHDYAEVIDVDQMWAEALDLAVSGKFDYKFSMPDFKDFEDYNAKYVIETPGMKAVRLYLQKPATNEDGEWLQPATIMHYLVHEKRLRSEWVSQITPETLGRALTFLGFQHKSVRIDDGPRKCYYVQKI